MCGSTDEKVTQQIEPFMKSYSTKIQYIKGGPGMGQHMKMCNQIAVANNMLGITESLLYGHKAGLNLK